MYNIKILNNITGRRYEAQFETEQEMINWRDKHISNDTFGKDDRYVRYEEHEVPEDGYTSTRQYEKESAIEAAPEYIYQDEDGYDIVVPATEAQDAVMGTEYFYLREYTIDEEDLSLNAQYMLEDIISKRVAEYPTTQDIIHVLLDHGLDSPEMQELQDKRAEIKAKYPKS